MKIVECRRSTGGVRRVRASRATCSTPYTVQYRTVLYVGPALVLVPSSPSGQYGILGGGSNLKKRGPDRRANLRRYCNTMGHDLARFHARNSNNFCQRSATLQRDAPRSRRIVQQIDICVGCSHRRRRCAWPHASLSSYPRTHSRPWTTPIPTIPNMQGFCVTGDHMQKNVGG